MPICVLPVSHPAPDTFRWGRVEVAVCPTCGQPRALPHVATTPMPALRQVLPGSADDTLTSATDGCPVDLDALCPHGHPSWARQLGLHDC